MASSRDFRDLLVWQQAMDLVVEIYRLTKVFDRSEEFELKKQMRRAAVSIPSNIAEGSARGTKKDFVNFLRMASGSNRELETQLEIAARVGFLELEQAQSAQAQITSVAILLNKLIVSMSE